jgi:hypothetical protein
LLPDDEQLARVLAERFGLRLPPGASLKMANPAGHPLAQTA